MRKNEAETWNIDRPKIIINPETAGNKKAIGFFEIEKFKYFD